MAPFIKEILEQGVDVYRTDGVIVSAIYGKQLFYLDKVGNEYLVESLRGELLRQTTIVAFENKHPTEAGKGRLAAALGKAAMLERGLSVYDSRSDALKTMCCPPHLDRQPLTSTATIAYGQQLERGEVSPREFDARVLVAGGDLPVDAAKVFANICSGVRPAGAGTEAGGGGGGHARSRRTPRAHPQRYVKYNFYADGVLLLSIYLPHGWVMVAADKALGVRPCTFVGADGEETAVTFKHEMCALREPGEWSMRVQFVVKCYGITTRGLVLRPRGGLAPT